MNKIIKFVFVSITCLSLLNCHRKPIVSSSQSTPIDTVAKINIDSSIVEIQVNDIQFEYLQAKGKLAYQDVNSSVNAHFNIRMKRDSLIWISASQLGIEGMRFLITKDSIFGINRLTKDTYIYSIKHFKETFNIDIDFNTFQSIIVGNMPMRPEKGDKLIEESKYSILKRNKETYDLEAYLNIETHKLEKMITVQKPLANTLNIIYTDFKPLVQFLFPYKTSVALKYLNNQGLMYNSIYLEFNKVELDEKELKFPFKIPKRFNEP